MSHTFPKSAKLCGQMRIQQLHQMGNKLTVWPLRVTWMKQSGSTQVVIWAPKSLFKHATDRNLLRRRMREAWRANNEEISQGYQVALDYIDHHIQNYAAIEHGVKKAIRKIIER